MSALRLTPLQRRIFALPSTNGPSSAGLSVAMSRGGRRYKSRVSNAEATRAVKHVPDAPVVARRRVRKSNGTAKALHSNSPHPSHATHASPTAEPKAQSIEMPLPKPADYPDAKFPTFFFRELQNSPVAAYHNFLKGRGVDIHCDLQQRGKSSHCVILVSGALSATIEASAPSKRNAVNAAHQNLISKLHTEGVLRKMFAPDDDLDKLDKDVLRSEADAKMDLHNYAARFLLTPQVAIRQVERPHGRRRRGVFDAKVELPEQGISVVSRAHDIPTAELSACLKFKKAAEEYHAQHGEQSMSVRDQTALHSGNAKLFFDFLKHSGKLRNYSINTASVGTQWSAEVMLVSSTDSPDEPARFEAVTMSTKAKAEALACLVAAVNILKTSPALQQEFQKNLSSAGDAILFRPRPVQFELERNAVTSMSTTLRKVATPQWDDDGEHSEADEQASVDPRGNRLPMSHDHAWLARKSDTLLKQQQSYQVDPKLAGLREKRDALPMSQYRDRVLEMVGQNRYSIIIGATGSGKSTQVPQILLEDAIARGEGATCNVVCTQPRRIAATSVARRVADERAEPFQKSVGYHVRFDPKRAQHGGSITYCTTGILLQQMQHMPDQIFDATSHIIIDEVHERDINIDFLMIILKSVMQSRLAAGKSVPRVTLMSATIDPELFSNYFQNDGSGGTKLPCPSLRVPGRTFPVKEKYLEDVMADIQNDPEGTWFQKHLRFDRTTKDYIQVEQSVRPGVSNGQEEDSDPTIEWKRERKVTADGEVSSEQEDALVPIPLIAASVASICKQSDDGAVLVFLPGYEEIKAVRETLVSASPLGVRFDDPARFRMAVLHSSVPHAEQAQVFDPVPPGCRKIILSTNIAETSVTIPDVKYVVDTGKLREFRYDQVRRISRLQCTWISKSNAKQRGGRAGRVQNGHYHALYSRARFDSLRSVGLPEMLRTDLQVVCLSIKAQAFKAPIRDFLAQAIEPPSAAAVDAAVQHLQELQALTTNEDLTPLGRVLARLPVHPSLGKMIILGVIFRCLDPMIVLGAALEERSLFVSPPDKRREAQAAVSNMSKGNNSDHLTLLTAFQALRQQRKRGTSAMIDFAYNNFLHVAAFRAIENTARQIEEVLRNHGLIPEMTARDRSEDQFGHPTLNANATNPGVVKALAVAGLHPNLGLAQTPKLFRTASEVNVMLHPSSVNHKRDAELRAAAAQRGSELAGAGAVIQAGDLMAYTNLSRSNDQRSLFMRETSRISPMTAFLFGGTFSSAAGNVLEVDGWLPFFVNAGPDDVRVLASFRRALDGLLARSFRQLARPDAAVSDAPLHQAFVQGIADLLGAEDAGAPDARTPRRHGRGGDPADATFAGPGARFGPDDDDPWSMSPESRRARGLY